MTTNATTQLHARLLELHRMLLALVRGEYEKAHGPIGSPGAMLQLVINDEAFAWLRPLSTLLVELDDKDIVPDAAAARGAVEGLLGGNNAFRARYSEVLEANADIAAEHAQVMRIVRGLPEKLPRVSA